MSTFWRYLKTQAFILVCGIVGPLFLAIYFVTGAQPIMKWMLWAGLLITAADVLIALAITGFGSRSKAKTQALEDTGVLALAEVTGIQETGTQINGRPLVKIDLQITGNGITPFSSQDRVIASVTRLPMITNRKLVALVDPASNSYQIDWERSALVGGLMPARFNLAEDNSTHDLTGQPSPLMEILQILKAHHIPMNNMIDLRANPAARRQVQEVVRRATTAQAPAPAAAPAPAYLAPPEPSTAQRLQELETLRATGAISEDEYTSKRRQIIAEF